MEFFKSCRALSMYVLLAYTFLQDGRGFGYPVEAAGETAAFWKYFQVASAQVKIISERVHKYIDKGGQMLYHNR